MNDSLRLIIPIKPLPEAKSRLAGTLTPAERETLSRRFIAHVLSVAAIFPGVAATAVVSADAEVQEMAQRRGMTAVPETEIAGQSAAVACGLAVLDPDARCDVLVLPSDLPQLTPDDIRSVRRPPICLAPDRHGSGTNALFMAAAHRIPLRFGPGSLARHIEEARRLGIEPEIVRRPGIAFDVDTEEDYRRLTTFPD